VSSVWLCPACERDVSGVVCPECGRVHDPERGGLRLHFRDGAMVLKWDAKGFYAALREAEAKMRRLRGKCGS